MHERTPVNHMIIEKQQARDYDIEVRWFEDGRMEKTHVPVSKRDESTKCHRCYQYDVAKPSDYNLCPRCQRVMSQEYNHLCVSCGSDDASDNLCNDCRSRRIAEYDTNYMKNVRAKPSPSS